MTPTLPPLVAARFVRRVVKPWGALAREWAVKLGVPWSRVVAFIWAESQGDAAARSPAGALGLMQLLHPGWREGLDDAATLVPATNVRLGVTALAKLGKRDPDLASVASRYNAGQDPKTGAPWPGPAPYGVRAAPGYIDNVIAAHNTAAQLEASGDAAPTTPAAGVLVVGLVLLVVLAVGARS